MGKTHIFWNEETLQLQNNMQEAQNKQATTRQESYKTKTHISIKKTYNENINAQQQNYTIDRIAQPNNQSKLGK